MDIDLLKWLTSQTSNGLLIIGLALVSRMFYKANERLVTSCEEEKKAFFTELREKREAHDLELKEQRQMHGLRMDALTSQAFTSATEIANVTTRAIEILERVEKKL